MSQSFFGRGYLAAQVIGRLNDPPGVTLWGVILYKGIGTVNTGACDKKLDSSLCNEVGKTEQYGLLSFAINFLTKFVVLVRK